MVQASACTDLHFAVVRLSFKVAVGGDFWTRLVRSNLSRCDALDAAVNSGESQQLSNHLVQPLGLLIDPVQILRRFLRRGLDAAGRAPQSISPAASAIHATHLPANLSAR